MLRVRLLGQFDVQRDHTPITIPSRLAQSLLAYLLLTAGIAHRREKLAGLLWPDTTEEAARRNLRQELWRLRKAIEPKAPRKRAVSYLRVNEVTVGFNPQSDFWLDAALLAKSNVTQACTQELIDELTLYRGELLPGFYDEWAVLERERIRAIFEQKIARLLDLMVADRCWPLVLDWAERWISLGRSPEPAYRALMIAHSELGDRAKVGVVFERCVRALREDLDVEPSPETRALFLRLSKDNASLRTDDIPSSPLSPQPPRTHLPVPLTSFVGRKREIEVVQQLLCTTHLLTLIGAGGCGKTRLALQIAREMVVADAHDHSKSTFPDGIWFIDLAPVSDPSLIPQVICSVFGLRQVSDTPLDVLLQNLLRSKCLLLVVDNCEHLIQACAELCDRLLRACPGLKILATSREVLNIAGEMAFRVPSLSLPDLQQPASVEILEQSESVRLFIERAHAACPDIQFNQAHIQIIAKICRRLDGIPLAIELGAARTQSVSIEEIASRLYDRFRLLTSGSRAALPRYQTLRASIDWSYDLLSDAERALLRLLAIFAGGFTLDAAEAVCTEEDKRGILDLLSQLVRKSLVILEPSATSRYRLLETIREYALAKLDDSFETALYRTRHLNYFLKLAEELEPRLYGLDQRQWLDLLEMEHDNIRAALRWAAESDNGDAAMRLAIALDQFWFVRGYFTEARARLKVILDLPSASEPGFLERRARVLRLASKNARQQTDYAVAVPLAHASVEICRTLGDKEGIAEALMNLGLIAWERGEYASARSFQTQSLAIRRELGNRPSMALSLMLLGTAIREGGDYAEGRRLIEEALAIQRELNQKQFIARALMHLGSTAIAQGDPAARSILEEGLAIFRELGDKWGIGRVLHDLAQAFLRLGDYEVARTRFAESAAALAEIGDRRNLVKCVEGLAEIDLYRKRLERATQLFGASEAIREKLGTPLPSTYRANYEHAISALCAQANEELLAEWWAEGRTMTLEQAMERALEH